MFAFLYALPMQGPVRSSTLHPHTGPVHWAMMKMSSSLPSLPALNEWCSLSWRCRRCCHVANFFKPSGYLRSLCYAWSVTTKPSFPRCVDRECPYNCSFFQGFLPLWGDVIKSLNYSMYFILRGSFLSPQCCIIFEISSCCWETYTLTLWPGVYILEKLLEVI